MARRPQERQHLELARAWHASPKRFNGWEPSYETVYEYDDSGRLVRSVTRQIEPEWDDLTRRQVEALQRHDDECCPGCGMHKSVLEDFDNRHFIIEERFCPACADQARAGRVMVERDDKATPKDKDGRAAWEGPRDPRPDDGRHIYIRELSPAEVEARKSKREAG